MSTSERLTRGCIEDFRVACAAWIPGRVAELDREKFSNNPSVALGQLNQICDLALRALDSDNAAGQAAEKLAVDPEKSECGLATPVPTAPEASYELARWLKWAQFRLGVLEGYAQEGKLLTVLAKVEEMQTELRKLVDQESK